MEILQMRTNEELPTPNIIIKKIHFHVSSMTKTNEKQRNKYLPLLLRIEAKMGHFVNPPDPVQSWVFLNNVEGKAALTSRPKQIFQAAILINFNKSFHAAVCRTMS